MQTPGIRGINAGNFSIASNGCAATVAPSGSCTIDVRFTPTYTGSRSAALSIPSNAVTGAASVALSGTGTGLCLLVRVDDQGNKLCLELGL